MYVGGVCVCVCVCVHVYVCNNESVSVDNEALSGNSKMLDDSGSAERGAASSSYYVSLAITRDSCLWVLDNSFEREIARVHRSLVRGDGRWVKRWAAVNNCCGCPWATSIHPYG